MGLRYILEIELTGLVGGLDLRGEGRKQLGGFWLEQLWSIVLFTKVGKTEGGNRDRRIAVKLKVLVCWI